MLSSFEGIFWWNRLLFRFPLNPVLTFEVRIPRKRKSDFWQEDSINTFLQKDENKWARFNENYHTKLKAYTKTKVCQETKRRHMGLGQLWKRNDHTNYFTFQGFPLINWCWKFINSLKFSGMSLLLRVVHSNLTRDYLLKVTYSRAE